MLYVLFNRYISNTIWKQNTDRVIQSYKYEYLQSLNRLEMMESQFPQPVSQNNIDQQEKITQNPVLIYPPIRGSVQPIRNLLYYLGVEFQESGINSSGSGGSNIEQKITQAGFNTGYPRLVHGEIVITDVIAIFRHVCRYYKRIDLLGLTPQNRAIINEFLFNYTDIQSKLIKKIFQGAKTLYELQIGQTEKNSANMASTQSIKTNEYEQKLQKIKQIIESDAPNGGLVKNLLLIFMKNKSWIFGYLTIADFFFYQICFYISGFFKSAIINHPTYRNFHNFAAFFESQEFFQVYKQKIMQKKLFSQGINGATLEILRKYWQGNKDIIA